MRRAAALSAALMLAASCGRGDEPPPAQKANTVVVDGTVANDHGTASVTASGERVTVSAGDFYFRPTVITGPAGEAVALDIASESQNIHNVTLGDVEQDVGPGESIEMELTFPASGTAVFVCRYHGDRGMAGALVST